MMSVCDDSGVGDAKADTVALVGAGNGTSLGGGG